jgi:hypothetical protein
MMITIESERRTRPRAVHTYLELLWLTDEQQAAQESRKSCITRPTDH